ncbi:putative neutral amino acid permease protein [Rosellinia necatrix]|uniref:Putative neutral amino acid permease protein n=1 Tax=Rosellinia necatrix TaxID=77044 RepID=A0A1S8A847_ROSNE|nr:putative neutral amino acid permease protein [Rosellinia necatrix]
MLDVQRDLKRKDEAKKWRRSIAKTLGFPGTTLDSDGEPVPTWQRAFDTRLNSLVDHTGAWWRTDDRFSHWATARHPMESILVLSGTGGTGKTSMMANTIKSIRRLDSEAPSSRVVAVYYFADGDKRKPDDDDESSYLERISRTLLWQLATSYEAMTKSVALAVERATHLDGALDHWDQLFFNNKELQHSNTTFYLFIDTLDHELLVFLQKYCKLAYRQKVRIFLTARPELVAGYLDQADDVSFSEIQITKHNNQDVERYIISRMDTMPMLRDINRQGISEWRQLILAELRDKCVGDYFKLNTSISALAKVDLIEDIREVLKDAGKPRADQIRVELRRLNNNRTIKEIREINEIILWVENGRHYFSVDMMDALLSVRHLRPSITLRGDKHPLLLRRETSGAMTESTEAEEPAALTTISLLPLAQKLRDKYPIFNITDSGVIDWRNSEIRSQIPTKESQQDIIPDIAAVARPQVIQESEINIIRHFLSKFCPEELYARFEFEDFFNQKLGAGMKEYIHLDPDNAEIRIVFTCLVILTDEELRCREPLRRYAMYWLLEHLQAVNLSAADWRLKRQVGPLLVQLFTGDCGIDSLFWCFDSNVSSKTWEQGEAARLREARNEWVYSAAGVKELRRWLEDSAVIKYVTSDVGKDFVTAVKTPGANLHKEALSHAAKRMARHLFIEVEFLKRHFLAASCFLRGFLARMEGKPMPDDPAVYRDDQWEDYEQWEGASFPLSELEKIEAWAFQELPNSKSTPAKESLWEIHGALQVFQLCDGEREEEVSQRRAKKALELNPQNWHACHFVACRPSTSTEEGVELLKRAKNAVDAKCAKNANWMNDSANSSLLARITFDLGNKLWELGDFSAAARTHRESLRYNYYHFHTYAKILGQYRESQQWVEFIAFIETLNKESNKWDAYLDELVNDFIIDLIDQDSNVLAQAADATSRWDVIENFFKLATDIGHRRQAYDLLFLLREAFARTLELTDGPVDEKTVTSIREAALESIRAHPSDTLPQTRIYAVTDLLAQTYLDNAFKPKISDEKVESLGLSMSALLPDVSDLMDAWGYIVTVCCIIRYHHKLGTKSGPAKRWIERIVRTGLEFLSDSDEDNDSYAYSLLASLFVAVEDNENHIIAWNMQNAIQAQHLARWEDWVSTPIASPVKIKLQRQDSIASRLEMATSQARPKTPASPKHQNRPSSVNGRGKERGNSPNGDLANRPSSANSGSKERGHSPNGDIAKDDGKAVRTARSSSAPNPAHEEAQPRAPPARISTDIVEAAPDDAPPKPTSFVICDGCDKEWTVMDEPLLSCADCVGIVQLDRQCHASFMKGELKKKGLRCKKEHRFLEVPSWDADRFSPMPKGYLPFPVNADSQKRWIPLEEWKKTLKRLYLPE